MITSRRALLVASVLSACVISTGVSAQTSAYPIRPIRILYTFAAGGTGDAIARKLGESMQKILGQPVIVENRTGASGAIGALAGAQAAGDGYTLLLTTITTVVQAPLVLKNAESETIKTLVPIANLAMTPLVLVVNEKVPANDFPSFAKWVKEQPDGVNVAVAGATLEVATALLKRDANMNLINVAYKGQAPALQAVVGGEVNVFFSPPSATLTSFVNQGKLKVLGVTSAEVSPAVPNGVPISKYVPGYIQDINFALWTPAGTPSDVVSKLSTTVRQALSEKGMAEVFLGYGVPLSLRDAADVTRITNRETENIRKVMATTPIKFGG